MGVLARFRRWLAGVSTDPIQADAVDDPFGLELRRDAIAAHQEAIISLPTVGIDTDDALYRATGGASRFTRRDLTPMQQDRMIQIAWMLIESNPFARRLIEMMTDLIVGEGISASAKNPQTAEIVSKAWNHPVNNLGGRSRELYRALSVNGELCMPVVRNPITGIPRLGYIDPLQIERVETRADNVMVPDVVVLKATGGATTGARMKIVQEDPTTGRLDGECFYHRINALPNGARGRSDLLTQADWLDLYDQLMFAEVERVKVLGAFCYDLKVEGGTPDELRQKARDFRTMPASGGVYAHNQKETLTAITPDIQAGDKSEFGKQLAIHICGSMGFPLTWLGFSDSNRATVEGQNDVMMKTPSARQKEFAGFLQTILRFAVESAMERNKALYPEADLASIKVEMPEIAAKDISRVGATLASVVSAMDTGMANGTMSKRAATTVVVSILRHLGVDLSIDDVMAQADEEAADRQAAADERQAALAAQMAARVPGAGGPVAPAAPVAA